MRLKEETRTLFSMAFGFLMGMIAFYLTSPAFSYDRADWSHWNKQSGTCLNTRQVILKERSLIPVTYKGKKNCTIAFGKWEDFYYAETLTRSGDIDIDHIIPLKYADDLVGDKWSRDEKKIFANDPDNLVVTNKRYNRQKGAKSILQWLPVGRQYACRYMARWLYVKNKYRLPISKEEKETYSLTKCQ